MLRSFFHHISLLCYLLFSLCSLSLPLPPCHCCMVTQTLQRCYIWMVYGMSHTPSDSVHLWKVFLYTYKFSNAAQTHIGRMQPLKDSAFFYPLQLQQKRRQWAAMMDVSNSPLHLPSWLNKQADFNDVPFETPRPLLHNKPVHTQSICQSAVPRRGKVFLHSLALSLSICQYVSLLLKGRVFNHSHTLLSAATNTQT